MPTRIEAIKDFLDRNTLPELAKLYTPGHEVQVTVKKDDGERINREYKGRSYAVYRSASTGEEYGNIRIPRNADTVPEYRINAEMTYSLDKHCDCIGMTGWKWQEKESHWFGYDFDSISGHSPNNPNTLTDQQLEELREKATAIPWVTVRRSTSGSGYHFYVFVEPGFKTETHTEHAAAARAILVKMSAYCGGFNFADKIDVCGSVLWVYSATKMNKSKDSLVLVKKGRPIKIDEIPVNWRDHMDVVSLRRTKVRLPIKDSSGNDVQKIFDQMAGQTNHIKLDEEHTFFLTDYENFCRAENHQMYWDNDNHMLVTHTLALKSYHEKMKLKGLFMTNSSGSSPINCFCYPIKNGGWSVIRYGKGTGEHPSWEYDGKSWTKCKYNVPAEYHQIVTCYGGVEDPKTGGFFVDNFNIVFDVCKLFEQAVTIPELLLDPSRKLLLTTHKDGRIIVNIAQAKDDPDKISGWIKQGKLYWVMMLKGKVEKKEAFVGCEFDETIRHLTTGQNGAGWMIKNNQGNWIYEKGSDTRKVIMNCFGYNGQLADMAMGKCIQSPWKIVNKPFVEEYPGDREWNLNSAQFTFTPSMKALEELHTPTWDSMFNHCGRGLDAYVKVHPWCIQNNIKTGGEYLKCWAASMFQFPDRSLPYLFFYSKLQDSGKSSFHESLQLLLNGGKAKVSAAVTNQSGFNKEMEGSILCYIDEFNINTNANAYDILKDWITSPTLMIQEKYKTPYLTKNTCHFVQTANNPEYCIILPGDTRIVMVNVPPLEKKIKREDFQDLLKKEAPDILAMLLKMELPFCNDRLNIPIIETSEKLVMQTNNASALDSFILSNCRSKQGHCIPYSEFYNKFNEWLDSTERTDWSKKTVLQKLPPEIPRGRLKNARNGNKYIGNISWVDEQVQETSTKYIQVGDWLEVST